MSTTQDMTRTESGQEPRDLGPFQRAAMGTVPHMVVLRALAPAGPVEELRDAVVAAVTAAPVLTAEHVEVPGMRVPRQVSTPCTVDKGDDGEWVVRGGTLRATVTASDAGRELEIVCSAAFADTSSLNLLLANVSLHLEGRTPEPAVDFFVVAPGHIAMLREGELDAEETYWARRREDAGDGLGLDDIMPVSDTEEDSSAADVRRPLTPEESEGLDALAESLGCEVADLAQLALDTVLLRLGAAPGVLGRFEDARGLMGLEGTIGPLGQVVPGSGALVDLLGTARDSLGALTEQRKKDAEMSGGPAFQPYTDRPGLVLDRTGGPVAPQGWRILSWWNPVGGGIALGSWRHDGVWELRAQTERGGAERLKALVAMWSGLLRDLIARPGARLSELQLLPDGVSAGFMEERERPSGESVTARLERHFTERADVPACRQGERTWTYGMLRDRMGRIAEALSHLPRGAVVAVALEPGFDLVAAQTAVLWVGAVFIPLSQDEPPARLLDALERSEASALIVEGEGGPELRLPPSCERIELAGLDTRPFSPTAPADMPSEAPAYMMRTSGSTGRPKLLEISRGSLDNYLRWVEESLLGEGEEFPFVSSPVFDASIKQTLGSLYSGAAVRLLESDRLDPEAVRDELAGLDGRIVLNCVPGYLSELLAADERRETVMPITRFLVGGEPLPSELVRRVGKRYPDAEIWNLYGPTEATATATAGRITDPDRVHVGRPVAGAGLAVVDSHGAVLPRGVRGEVVITGPGLSSGYVAGHEGPSPFTPLDLAGSSRPSYRTGDVGYIDREGDLRLMGRADSQVKINGWRIDPGELERVAQGIEGVQDAVVVLDDRSEERCLRLFTTGGAEAEYVLERLREVLPTPMLPASVTPLERLDTGVTGKVDRKALLERSAEREAFSPEEYTPRELAVATVWKEILQQGWPDPRTDFFNAGGHSLLLARLVNRLRAGGHRELSLRQVVRNPTVASIAALIDHTS